MNSAESSLYTVAVTMCVFSAGLLRRRTRTGWSLAWLTWFLVIEALAFTLELLMAHPAVPLKGLWLGLRLGTSLLIAPCLWLAVRETIEGVRPRLADLGRGSVAAIAIGFLLTVPLIEDAHLGVTYANPERTISWLHARLIHTTMLGCIGIFAVQAPLFLWRCRALLVRHAKTRGAETGWLQLPLVVVATTWMLGLLRTIQCATHAPKELALVFALADVGVTVGAVYVLVRRVSFGELAVAPSAPVVAEAAPLAKKYARSNLDGATRLRIRGKIESVLAGPEFCCDSLLNLRSFSRAINEKAHYVSQVINQDLGTSFYELVNRHRIDRARQLLLAAKERTILEIALAVGFNSKSTFNTAFRRLTGVTPSEFRASGKG